MIFRRETAWHHNMEENGMGTVWLTASGKGGVGKSTLTSALGQALAGRNKRVLIMDMDVGLRGQDILLSLQDRVVMDLMDVLDHHCEAEEAIIPSPGQDGLFLLPCPQFSRVKEISLKALGQMIRKLKGTYDFILMDAPAGVEKGLRNLLKLPLDEIILVVTPDDLCLRDAERVISILDRKDLPAPKLLVNRLMPGLIERGEMISAASCAASLDCMLLGEVPDDSSVYRAQLNHFSLMELDCEARQAAVRIAGRMLGDNIPFPAYGHRRPWYSRMFHPMIGEVKRIDR